MFNLPKNIYVLAIVISLSFSTMSMMILVSGLLGNSIAPSPSLATLPLAVMVVGTAVASIPAALIMQRIGRKKGLAAGLVVALLGTMLSFYAASVGHFWLFVIGSALLGFNAAFIQQSRFIIFENAQNEKQQADGLTLGLLANLFGAIVGPWLGASGKDLVESPAGYAGSFLLIAVVLCIALFILLWQFRDIQTSESVQSSNSKPLFKLISNPLFIIASGSAAIGFGVMSLVMTATPISMHEITGHSLDHTTLVIQSHIAAMFLPSLLSGALLKRGYRIRLILLGLGLYALVSVIALNGISVMHYWWALLLLGIGWNLLFLISTALLSLSHSEQDKFKAQAANDFIVFSFQAIASFAAGWLLFSVSWNGVAWVAAIFSVVWAIVVLALVPKARLVMQQTRKQST